VTTGLIDRAPRIAAVDVCVIGAGSAGSTAAIAAARCGASVLLVDRLPFLGGTSTAVLDTFYGFYTPGSTSRKVVGGIGDDVVAGLRGLGPVIERPNTYGAGTGITYLAEHLKVVWEDLVTGAGALPPIAEMRRQISAYDESLRKRFVASKRHTIEVDFHHYRAEIAKERKQSRKRAGHR